MCFNASVTREAEYLEERFEAEFTEQGRAEFEPIYHASAFSLPFFPVVSDDDTDAIRLYQWGLIPYWVEDRAYAEKIRYKTFNARAETLFERPSFRRSVREKRCLVIVDGFYEWKEVNGKKYPHYIRRSDGDAFALAGLWDSWSERGKDEGKDEGKEEGKGEANGEGKEEGNGEGNGGRVEMRTFSVITTPANPLLARIHNTKKRMPAVLERNSEKEWTSGDLDDDAVHSLLRPYEGDDLEAYPISKLITARGRDNNVSEVRERFEYEELGDGGDGGEDEGRRGSEIKQTKLF